jgi:hypothetical protein
MVIKTRRSVLCSMGAVPGVSGCLSRDNPKVESLGARRISYEDDVLRIELVVVSRVRGSENGIYLKDITEKSKDKRKICSTKVNKKIVNELVVEMKCEDLPKYIIFETKKSPCDETMDVEKPVLNESDGEVSWNSQRRDCDTEN